MYKLYMLLVGCKPKGRNTEQHDIFFGVGESLRELVPQIKEFWPEAVANLHVDGWRELNQVDGYSIRIVERTQLQNPAQLFFINLGGYKPNEFEEFHYKMLIAAKEKGEAIQASKQTAFFKHTGFKGANSHIDDKYGVDVDDVFEIQEVLPASIKTKYSIQLEKLTAVKNDDPIHLGYFKLDKIEQGEFESSS